MENSILGIRTQKMSLKQCFKRNTELKTYFTYKEMLKVRVLCIHFNELENKLQIILIRRRKEIIKITITVIENKRIIEKANKYKS